MNALSTRLSESTGYVHPISRMAVDAKGTPAIWKLMNATPACLRAENVRAQARGTTEDLPNVDSTCSGQLRNAGTAVRPRLRAGNAADGARTSRAVRGCAGKARDHWRRNPSRHGQGQPQHRNRG